MFSWGKGTGSLKQETVQNITMGQYLHIRSTDVYKTV